MPKLIEKDSPIYDVIWSNIRRIQYLEHIPDYYLAEALNVTERTLINYDKEPQKITLERIQKFMDATNVTIDELILK